MNSPLPPHVELAFFRQLWQKSNDPFWLCECVGNDFAIVLVNPAEMRIDPRLRPGVNIRALLPPGPASEELLSGYFVCRDTGQSTYFSQHVVLAGVPRHFETLLVPVADARGVVTHIYGTTRDMTSFFAAQEELRELNRELEQRVDQRTRELHAVNAELREANCVLERLAAIDSLTELANRRRFFEHAATEVRRAQRYGHPLSLQLLDIDHFKRINDEHGHAAGDHALRRLADVLRADLRHNDLAARIGGEEFVILLSETGPDDAAHHAERLRQKIAAQRIDVDGATLVLTVSIGIAALAPGETSVEPMLARADAALYESKFAGRNRVAIARSEASHSRQRV